MIKNRFLLFFSLAILVGGQIKCNGDLESLRKKFGGLKIKVNLNEKKLEDKFVVENLEKVGIQISVLPSYFEKIKHFAVFTSIQENNAIMEKIYSFFNRMRNEQWIDSFVVGRFGLEEIFSLVSKSEKKEENR